MSGACNGDWPIEHANQLLCSTSNNQLEVTMHTPMGTPARAQGYLAAVLLSCLTLLGVGCSKQNHMATNPSTNLSTDQSQGLTASRSQAPQDLPLLGTASSFVVLGGSTVTSTGLSVLTGDLGVSPGTAITGFGPGIVNGTIHAGDPVAAQAQSDLTTAYNGLAGLPCGTSLTGQDLGGKTLAPGVYCFTSSAQLTGTLTLDAQGNPDAVFMFQIGSTLTTATNAAVVMINGGRDCNVFWQVGSSATLGTGTKFTGNIVALASITLTTGVSLSGRALARTGAVTMDTNTLTAGSCGPAVGPGDPCSRKVTGGGRIDVTGGSANFGFEVRQTKSGRLKGELQYENHKSGMIVRIKRITSLVVAGQTATFTGTGMMNGQPGSFTVTVMDQGESGRNDRFSLTVVGGSTAEGPLRSGNIQIHKQKCGHGDDDDDDDDDDGEDDGGHGDDGDHGDDGEHGGEGGHGGHK